MWRTKTEETTLKMSKSILIYGSCVSRDPFDTEPIKGSGLTIKSYLSKTAIISQASPKFPGKIDLPEDDGFLSRMVRLDAYKGVAATFREIGDSFLLIDFI